MKLDLRGIRQEDYLRRKQEREVRRGKRRRVRADANLTAIEPVGRVPGSGILWRAVCDCGGERTILARDFTSGAIRRCAECAAAAAGRIPKRPNAPPPIPEDCIDEDCDRAAWEYDFPESERRRLRAYQKTFSSIERLLYEVILDGRDGDERLEIEAIDLVARCEDARAELNEFGVARLTRAIERIKAKGGQ